MQSLSRTTAKTTSSRPESLQPDHLQLLSRAQESRNKEPRQGHRFKGGFSLRLMGKNLLSLFRFQTPLSPPQSHSGAVVSKHVFIYSLCVSVFVEFPVEKDVPNTLLLSLRQLTFSVFLTSHPRLWQQWEKCPSWLTGLRKAGPSPLLQ